MKKSVKAMVVAAAIAAVGGIGAVSFAAWNVGNAATQNTAGQSGKLEAIGSITLASNLTGTGAKKLVPCDQENYPTASMTNVWEITVTPPTAVDGYTYSYGVKYKADDTNDLGAAKLYVFTGNESYPSAGTKIEESALSSGWTVLSATDNTSVTLDSGNKIYIVMKSSVTDDSDMEKDFGVTVTCTATASAS